VLASAMDDAIGIGLAARPLLFVALAALAFLPLEHIAAAHPQRRRRFATDRPVFAAIGAPRARFVVETSVGLLLFELAGYATHRLAHAVPALWRLHEIHHSSETMDWLPSRWQRPTE